MKTTITSILLLYFLPALLAVWKGAILTESIIDAVV